MKFDFTLQQLIAYYRECYELDNKQLELYDFFSNQNNNRLIVASSKLISDDDYLQKVNLKWGSDVSQKLRVYEKEIDLYGSSYFFVTNTKVLGRIKLSKVPLFLTPLKLEFVVPNFFVSTTEKKTVVNPQAVKAIASIHPKYTLDEVFELLEKASKIKDLIKRTSFLKHNFEAIDSTFLDESTRFLSQTKLKEVLKTKKKNYLLPVLGLGLLNKPSASRGVLSELKDIALENKFYPELIESVFLGTNYNITSEEKEVINVPVNLSIPQKSIIKSAYQNNLTLAVGPPGTGKSFTIASIAVDAIANGKSVLISSKNDQALKVIKEKLERDFNSSDSVITSGEKYFVRRMRSKIQHLLNINIYKERKKWLKKEVDRLEKAIINLEKNIEKATSNIDAKSDLEIDISELLVNDSTFINKVKLFFKERKAKYSTSLISEVNSIQYLTSVKKEWTRSLLNYKFEKSIAELMDDHELREDLKKMIKVLESDSGLEKESLFYSIDFQKILKAFPIWLVNLKELNEYLPLKDGVFDLVIIDEATQCDIASSIPLLYRGKRAVVVGDPKQLRHVSFLSYEAQEELANKYGVSDFSPKLLDYRNTSVLDVVMETLTSQKQVHYLDEHYRSMPDIVDFSNDEFYNSSLNIMTFKSDNDLEENIIVNKSLGNRDAKGVNQKEIDDIFDLIRKNKVSKKGNYSVGIISPFANQVKEVQKQVSEAFSVEELGELDLLVGTPYHFQGEERDEVHITFTVDSQTASNVYTYLNKEAVFNVAITRARQRQYIYHSLNSVPHSSKHLLHRYLQSIEKGKKESQVLNVTLDVFLNEVKDWLAQNKFKTFVAKEIAGVVIDLLVDFEGKLYALDLVGFPGVYQATFPIEKYKTLYRMDVEILVVPYSFWSRDNKKCKEFIQSKIG